MTQDNLIKLSQPGAFSDVLRNGARALLGDPRLFDLALSQVLSAAKLAVWPAPRGDCSVFGGWREQLQVRFGHGFSLLGNQ
jgi:hypothetical protein